MSDHQVRLAAFEWLSGQVDIHGDVLPWSVLQQGFEHRGERVPLLSQQGIFKPRVMELPLSIRTSVGGSYDDRPGRSGTLLYRYRGDDPQHRDNRGLREAMRGSVPLVYFFGIAAGKYLAVWPVFIVGDDAASLTFSVQVDDAQSSELLLADSDLDEVAYRDTESRRQYVTSQVRRRLHQRAFRERVLRAYREQCSLCRLRHAKLLDAAHIIPDTEEAGEPRVPNGIALCKLHHAAFDGFFLGIRPDYRIEVPERILVESDGPMLVHGLQRLHGREIGRPRRQDLWPDTELLERRYERFRAAQA